MKSNTTFVTADDFILIDHNPEITNSPARYSASLKAEFGDLHLSTLANSIFTLNNVSSKFNKDVTIMGKTSDKSSVSFVFVIQGNALVTDSYSNKTIAVTRGDCTFTFNKAVDEKIRFKTCDAHAAIQFELDLEYFSNLMFQQDDSFKEIKTILSGNTPFYRNVSHFSPSAQRIIADVYNCKFEGPLCNLILEGCIQQLIGLQLMEMQNLDTQYQIPALNKRDKEILYSLKDHLEKTYNENHSLLNLSRKFGMNQNKLNLRFKQLFGNTVIEYLYGLKMEHARRMICDEKVYVGEAAFYVGYKNPNHFATAFKRRFGISPSKLKS